MDIPLFGAQWNNLVRAGGVAAMIAGLIFRRNLGVELALFNAQKQPSDAAGWFALLQNDRLVGLAYLGVFDLANYLLVGLLFLALYVALRQMQPGNAAIAALSAFMGITAYLASNTALSLLALSGQHAATNDTAQRTALLAAGQALLALNRFSSAGAQPGSGGYISLMLVAVAGLIFSVVMWQSRAFGRGVAVVGLLANGLDLAYCALFLFQPAAGEALAVLFIPAAGFLFMLWHLLLGWRLLRARPAFRVFIQKSSNPNQT